MIDRDLAALYEVDTSQLNQAVRRNIDRFPDDFMFKLTQEESRNWISQIVISNSRLKQSLRKPPLAFTEQGIAMLSSVLNSPKAIQVNIQIIRIFTKLREMIDAYKELREKESEILEELLPEAFAAVREASRRTIGLRHFDVQLIGGTVLHEGKIAEMKTGEGKTLVATLALYLNALTGRGVHLITVNDYLARRDVQWMGPIYHKLGLSTASIVHEASYLYDPTFITQDYRYLNLRPITRQEAYLADITYGTNNEFGFDYLRDNMKFSLEEYVQRELNYAVVDEDGAGGSDIAECIETNNTGVLSGVECPVPK